MPGRIVDNKDSKNESLSLEKDSTMTIHPCEINSALFIDAQLGCHDNEALILDTFNNDSVLRKSEEMPNDHESLNLQSSIQKTDEIEQIEQLPLSPSDKIVSDSILSKGNCNCNCN